MVFTFYSTYYPPLTNSVPVTIDYSETSNEKLKQLREHRGALMIHSGNWWSMKHPEERTAENVQDGVRKIYTILKKLDSFARFTGYMTCNQQPTDLPKDAEPYWIGNPEKMIPYIKKSIKNANYALNNADIRTTSYCTIQVNNYEQAKKYFGEAYEIGHRAFAIGASEFLKSPKYRYDGIKKIFEIIKGIKDGTDRKCPIHISGLSSFNLVPFIAYQGATSCDGSTPVQSALAYGQAFSMRGKGMSASDMKKIYLEARRKSDNEKLLDKDYNKMKNWFNAALGGQKCECQVCHLHSLKQKIKIFNEGFRALSAAEARVDHNLSVWNNLIKRMSLEMSESPSDWLADFIKKQDSPYIRKIKDIFNKATNSQF